MTIAIAVPAAAQTGVAPSYGGGQPPSDADALASLMRRVAASPRDVDALATAGELSLRLGDSAGAAALLGRADAVDPRNPRVKAGMATLLLRSERPGEALRYFAQAEQFGIRPAQIAAERGLAYDLVGDQPRAQREYRLALSTQRDDETVRRYALSLGISGRRDSGLAELDPLIRKADRAAWRARAFVMAMNGDAAGASRIASTMMPGGTAAGLGGFFQTLPSLSAVDRAFAVHFGEVRATPERLADARLTPVLAPLPAEPLPAVAVAQAAAPVAVRPVSRGERRARERAERDARRLALAGARAVATTRQTRIATDTPSTSVEIASVRRLPGDSGPVRVAATGAVPAGASPAPSQSGTYAVAAPANAPVPGTAGGTTDLTGVSESGRLASGQGVPTPSGGGAGIAGAAFATRTTTQGSGVARDPVRPVGSVTSGASLAAAPRPGFGLGATTGIPAQAAFPSGSVAGAPATAAVSPTGPGTSLSGAAGGSAQIVGLAPAPSNPFAPVATTSLPPSTLAGPRSTFAPPQSGRADSILARIVAGLSVPATELGVVTPRPITPTPRAFQPAPRTTQVGSALSQAAGEPGFGPAGRRPVEATRIASRDAAPPTVRSRARVSDSDPDATPSHRSGRVSGRLAGRIEPADETPRTDARQQTGPRRTQADPDAVEELASTTRGATLRKIPNGSRTGRAGRVDPATRPQTAAERRAADREALAEAKNGKGGAARKGAGADAPAKREPGRIWVQVAGGADDGELATAWSRAQAKAPALAGKQGWTTPLRATNRVLTGPFKTEAEARALVNRLARQGVSAFSVTSEPGQKVSRLEGK